MDELAGAIFLVGIAWAFAWWLVNDEREHTKQVSKIMERDAAMWKTETKTEARKEKP